MGTMNGSAARRSTFDPPPQWEPPLELHARSWTEEHARSVFHARKWRTQGGLARQSVYAIIDMLLVCGSALLIYGMRFGFFDSWNAVVAPRQVIGHISVQAYPSFLVLYCSLIFLGCVSQGLYRTPRVVRACGISSRRQGRGSGHRAACALHLYLREQGDLETGRCVRGSGEHCDPLRMAVRETQNRLASCGNGPGSIAGAHHRRGEDGTGICQLASAQPAFGL